MKLFFPILFSFSVMLLSVNSYAGTDPIGWSVYPSSGLPVSTNMGSSYAVRYTLTNNLPFAVPVSVTGSYVGGSFGLINECNKTLAAKGSSGSSCSVHLSFQPTSTGVHTAQITVAYHKNKVPLTRLSTTVSSVESADYINGVVTTALPAVTYVGTSYPVAFKFINNGATAVTASSVVVTGFTASTNTCTSQLAESATCTVSGNFTPSSATQYTLKVTYNYTQSGRNVSVPVSTQTNAQNGSGPCHLMVGKTYLPLPASTLTYADHVVRFDFTNTCTSSSETLGQVSFSASDTGSSSPTISTDSSSDTCSNKTLAASNTCSVYASVIPNAATSDIHITATVPYNGNTYYADRTTHSTVNALTNQSSNHTMMFVNQCAEHVWYTFQNGDGSGSGINVKSPDPTPAADRTWKGYQLNQQVEEVAPLTKILQFPAYLNGTIAGRTKCETDSSKANYGTCQTSNCTSLPYNGVSNTTGTCNVSIAPSNPTTIFEQTLTDTTATDGSYDISLINGFNVPGEYRSLAPATNPINFSSACGHSAGAIIQPSASTLLNCPWSFTPPSTGTDCNSGTRTDNKASFYNVTPGSDDSCTPATTCSGSEVCGMAWTPQPASNPGYLGTPVNRRCGTFLGYWTINDWTNYSSVSNWGSCNLYNHYGLAATLDSIKTASQPTFGTIAGAAANLGNLFGCTAITSNGSLNSGYQSTVGQPLNVCGCEDWQVTINGMTYSVPTAKPCQHKDVTWHDYILSHISWLKEGCSTVYTYPYDDETSSFTCNVTGQRTSYQITFCPGGKTGAPS